MHDVMGVGGVIAGKAAEQRDEARAAGADARQVMNGGRKRAAMAKSDHAGFAAFDFAAKEIRADMAECRQCQRVVVDIGRDLAIVEPVAGGKVDFELDTFGDLAVDADLHHALGDRTGDQPVCLHRGYAEPLRHGRLGKSADIMQPGGADGERIFIVGHQRCPVLHCNRKRCSGSVLASAHKMVSPA